MLLHFIKKLNSKNISPSHHLFCIQWNSKSLAMAVVVSGEVFTCKTFRPCGGVAEDEEVLDQVVGLMDRI